MSAHQMDTYPNQHEYIFRHKVELHADYEINWVQSQIEFSRERIYCIQQYPHTGNFIDMVPTRNIRKLYKARHIQSMIIITSTQKRLIVTDFLYVYSSIVFYTDLLYTEIFFQMTYVFTVANSIRINIAATVTQGAVVSLGHISVVIIHTHVTQVTSKPETRIQTSHCAIQL